MSIPEYAKGILHILKERGESLCLAESATGGLLSSAITDISGSSQVFLGALVSYSNEVKIDPLGLPRRWLEKEGAVNKETAKFMAKGVKTLLKGDWSLSITGLMEPEGGSKRAEVFTAVCTQGFLEVKHIALSGNTRRENKNEAVLLSLDFLLKSLNKVSTKEVP